MNKSQAIFNNSIELFENSTATSANDGIESPNVDFPDNVLMAAHFFDQKDPIGRQIQYL